MIREGLGWRWSVNIGASVISDCDLAAVTEVGISGSSPKFVALESFSSRASGEKLRLFGS